MLPTEEQEIILRSLGYLLLCYLLQELQSVLTLYDTYYTLDVATSYTELLIVYGCIYMNAILSSLYNRQKYI